MVTKNPDKIFLIGNCFFYSYTEAQVSKLIRTSVISVKVAKTGKKKRNTFHGHFQIAIISLKINIFLPKFNQGSLALLLPGAVGFF